MDVATAAQRAGAHSSANEARHTDLPCEAAGSSAPSEGIAKKARGRGRGLRRKKSPEDKTLTSFKRLARAAVACRGDLSKMFSEMDVSQTIFSRQLSAMRSAGWARRMGAHLHCA